MDGDRRVPRGRTDRRIVEERCPHPRGRIVSAVQAHAVLELDLVGVVALRDVHPRRGERLRAQQPRVDRELRQGHGAGIQVVAGRTHEDRACGYRHIDAARRAHVARRVSARHTELMRARARKGRDMRAHRLILLIELAVLCEHRDRRTTIDCVGRGGDVRPARKGVAHHRGQIEWRTWRWVGRRRLDVGHDGGLHVDECRVECGERELLARRVIDRACLDALRS